MVIVYLVYYTSFLLGRIFFAIADDDVIDNNPHHLWIEDSLYHRQTINGINLNDIYGHFVEGTTG